MSADFKTEKMYTYLKGYCSAMNWQDALSALTFARTMHDGQSRKDGSPYLVHPLTIACHAAALNIRSESVIAACLLHDVVEDCNVTVEELPVQSQAIKDAVRRLTHVKPTPLAVYYKGIAENSVATVVKLLDRCDNVSTMAGVFSLEKTAAYIRETNEYVLPLYRTAKNLWPQYSDALFVLKYHIMSVVDGLQAVMEETRKAELEKKLSTPLGRVIKSHIEKHGCGLRDVAEELGMTQDNLEAYIAGTAVPNGRILGQMAKLTGTGTDELKKLLQVGKA